jgi:hypothetical protein
MMTIRQIYVFTLVLASTLVGHQRDSFAKPKFELLSQDGDGTMEIHLAAQIIGQHESEEVLGAQGRTSENKLAFRRIRPVLKGRLFGDDFSYLLHINLVPGLLELDDLWFDYRFTNMLSARMGQMKIPFTRHRLNSFKDRLVVDWSLPTRYFGAERQLGVMFHNGLAKPPKWEYQFGVFTGVNSRASNGVGPNEIYGESKPNSSLLVDPDKLTNMHTELVGHLAYSHGDINVRRPSDLKGGPFRYSVGASVAWDLKPTAGRDLSLRLAPEGLIKCHGFSLSAVFYLGFYNQLAGSEKYQLGLVSGLLSASYVFKQKYEVAIRYTNVHITDSILNDARSRADQLVALDSDLLGQYSSVGSLQDEQEIIIGFNWYLFETSLKWQVDAGVIIHTHTTQELYDYRVRTQLSLDI